MATGNSIGPKIQVDGVDQYYKDIQKVINQGKQLGKQMQEVAGDFDEAGAKSSTFGDVLKANLTSEAIIGGIKALGSAVATVGKAIFSFVSDSVMQFAELEQNIGGSEAVFGEYAKTIQDAAADAYKTMATTQSDYLATANKMGALFQGSGLDAQRSMELTTQAMQRAADMASVMGIDTQAALDAVTGAAKGNYTMMDNLGVAMNATTLEAYAVSQGMDTAWKSMSNAEKAELAMKYFFENTTQYAGNFEREASTTISGSIGQLTAAVQTWVAGLGNSSADIDKLTKNILDAFQDVVKNVVPVVENIVKQLPVVVQAIIPALESLFPSLVKTGIEVIEKLIDGIMDALPKLIQVAVPLITNLVNSLVNKLDKILDTGIKILLTLIEGIIQALPQLIARLPEIISKIVTTLMQNLPAIIQAGVQLILALIQGIFQMLTNVGSAAKDIFTAIWNALKDAPRQMLEIGKQIVQGIWNGISNSFSWIRDKIRGWVGDVLGFFKKMFGIHSPSKVFADQIGSNLALGIGQGFDNEIGAVARNMTDSIPMSFGMSGSGSYRQTNLGGVTITVNGAQGQNVQELADEIMIRMQTAVNRREAVFA